MADARTIKIPDSNGNLVSYPIKDVRNKRTRRNITNDLANLPTAIAEQNLQKYGYDVGDYFIGPNYEYILADENTFKGSTASYANVGDNHVTIVVRTGANCEWNDKVNNADTTATGYSGSKLHTYMVNTVLPNVKSDITALFGDWSAHLIKHSKLLSNGTAGWAWSNDQYISALTSVQIHGSPICDMNFYHTGEGNKPLRVFQKYFFSEIFRNINVWLRSVASASCPCQADARGHALGHSGASYSFGVVGLIIFK